MKKKTFNYLLIIIFLIKDDYIKDIVIFISIYLFFKLALSWMLLYEHEHSNPSLFQ